MMEDYDDIRNGYQTKVWKLNGKSWRFYQALLTHEKLILYKDDEVRNEPIS
jgi:hypothetical protein